MNTCWDEQPTNSIANNVIIPVFIVIYRDFTYWKYSSYELPLRRFHTIEVSQSFDQFSMCFSALRVWVFN